MANNNTVGSPAFASLVSPSVQKMTTLGSYVDIQSSGWAQQYLPELYEQEVTRYGGESRNRIAMKGKELRKWFSPLQRGLAD